MSDLILSLVKKRREELQAILEQSPEWIELRELDSFIATYEKLTTKEVSVTVLPPKQTRQRGKRKALINGIWDAIAIHKRPVRWAEIWNEVAKYGFTKQDYKQPSTYLAGSGFRYFKEHRGYWDKFTPLPNEVMPEWKKELAEAVA